MLTTAGIAVGYVVAGLLLAGPVSFLLARAGWPARAPGPALLLWQAVCLAAGFSVVGGLVLLSVAPAGHTLTEAIPTWFGSLFAGELRLPWWRWVCGALAAAISAVLLANLAWTTVLTVRRRRAHRRLVDLLTTPRSVARSERPAVVHVLESATAVAYTVPGWHPRVVVSAGLLDLLRPDELTAVVEHERAHLAARHDLLTLPFQAWASALGAVPGVRAAARSVAELVEMLADDVAAGVTGRSAVAAAVARVALSPGVVAETGPVDGRPSGAVPRPGPGAVSADPSGPSAATRVRRQLAPRSLPTGAVVGVLLAAFALLCLPASLLLIAWV
ncbi:M56 family metallopeptidase [Nakamurella flava]|uniref:M56 family metallopeptidase n=1 Tax=Nakamurella flava TaxID=2576308 RepID=A0A4U6QJJ3_9ACTN|nr:M56 family metallopeptidase [Nakamurella flava]TKV60252.1 M56 family metallopeptidase [Nakamurella flava]